MMATGASEEKLSSAAVKSRILGLDPYSRHKCLINQYFLYHPGSTSKLKRNRLKDRTDFDVIQEHHKFLWSPDDVPDTWEKRLARKYYDKLFKEYCIADVSRYKENKLALRWRTEQEVIDGKGQFTCGEKQCNEKEKLHTWEVNFAYYEQGEKKNALVKLRLCPGCSFKLNYHYQRKEIKKSPKKRNLQEKSHEETVVKRPRQGNSNEGNQEETSTEDKASCSSQSENFDIWKDKGIEERSKEEEFEDYLSDMLL